MRLAVVGAVALAAVGLLAAAGLDDSLVYYRTPSELSAQTPAGDKRVRLGGLVQPGSVARGGDAVRFVLTDGATEVTVVHHGDPPGVFQEGQGALVEGTFGPEGVFRSDLLLVKHSNEYRAPSADMDGAGGRDPVEARP